MADPTRLGPHARHDFDLVVAAAADDLAGSDRDRAADLMASCAECALLAADLRVIADSMRALGSVFTAPIAPAPRDFRLSDQDAARLGRSAGPPFGRTRVPRSWARGLGGALATLGLVGLLVSAVPLGFLGAAGGAATAEQAGQDLNADTVNPQQLAPAASGLSSKASEASGHNEVAEQRDEPAGSDGSATLAISAGVALLSGLALLVAARGGRRAGP